MLNKHAGWVMLDDEHAVLWRLFEVENGQGSISFQIRDTKPILVHFVRDESSLLPYVCKEMGIEICRILPVDISRLLGVA